MTTTLGTRLRTARTALGLSQAALAQQIGLSRVNDNLIERGKTRDPAVDTSPCNAAVPRGLAA